MTDIINSVRRFTEAVGCTTDQFNARQTALYTGLQLEELAEKIAAIAAPAPAPRGLLHNLVDLLNGCSEGFKNGRYDKDIAAADRGELLDADVDLAWVTLGSALSQGADVEGACGEVARANLDKIGPDGVVIKDENGKVRKPDGWCAPDLTPFVRSEP